MKEALPWAEVHQWYLKTPCPTGLHKSPGPYLDTQWINTCGSERWRILFCARQRERCWDHAGM